MPGDQWPELPKGTGRTFYFDSMREFAADPEFAYFRVCGFRMVWPNTSTDFAYTPGKIMAQIAEAKKRADKVTPLENEHHALVEWCGTINQFMEDGRVAAEACPEGTELIDPMEMVKLEDRLDELRHALDKRIDVIEEALGYMPRL